MWVLGLSHQVKENGLQDLLEAKAKALSQADRLIAQYRLQRAQAEAEVASTGRSFSCLGGLLCNDLDFMMTPVLCSLHAGVQACKLGSLLKEAERRGEALQVELGGQVLEVERSKADMEELLQHNARLQRDSEEHQALKGAYNSLLDRSEHFLGVQTEKQCKHNLDYSFHQVEGCLDYSALILRPTGSTRASVC